MSVIVTDNNNIPGCAITKNGGDVWIKDTGKVIKPVWNINKFLDSITNHNEKHVAEHIDKLVANMQRETARRGFNAIVCLNIQVKTMGEFASLIFYEVYIKGVMCQVEKI